MKEVKVEGVPVAFTKEQGDKFLDLIRNPKTPLDKIFKNKKSVNKEDEDNG